MKKTVIAGGLLAVAAMLTGCGLENIGGPKHSETVSYEVTEKVAALVVRGGGGDVAITEDGGDAVRVVETRRWSGDKPTAEHKVEGDTLRLSADCPDGLDSIACSVDYKVEIPKGLRTALEVGSGDVQLTSLTGPIEVTVGSGDVAGTELAGDKLSVKTGSGDADLRYASAPGDVQLKTGSGNASLHLPGGPYDVRSTTGAGDQDISVKNDANSPRKVTLDTGSGDVSVLAAN